MTDKEIKNIVHSEFDKIRADTSVKARVLKGLKGDTMETNDNKIAENKNITMSGAKVKTKGKYIAVAAALVMVIGGGTFLLGQKNNEIETAPQSTESQSVTSEELSQRANRFIETRTKMVNDNIGADIFHLSGDLYLIKSYISEYANIIFNADTQKKIASIPDNGMCNAQVCDNGFMLYPATADIPLSDNIDTNFYDFDGNLKTNFKFELADVEADNRERMISTYAVSNDGSVLYVAINGTNFDKSTFCEIYSVNGNGDITKIFDESSKTTGNIENIYPSEDGKTLYATGCENYKIQGDETSYSDVLVREIALDVADENGICKTNGIGLSVNDGYESSLAYEKNNKLYVMNTENNKVECFERDEEKAEEWKKTTFELQANTEGVSFISFSFTDSGKYLFAVGYVYNEDDGSLEKSVVSVFDGNSLSSEPVWTTEIKNGNCYLPLVDEESGAIVSGNCFDDGSAYSAIIGQDNNDTNKVIEQYGTAPISLFNKFFEYSDNFRIYPLDDNKYTVYYLDDKKQLHMMNYDRNTDTITKDIQGKGMEEINACDNGFVNYSISDTDNGHQLFDIKYYSYETLDMVYEYSAECDKSMVVYSVMVSPDGEKVYIIQEDSSNKLAISEFDKDGNKKVLDVPDIDGSTATVNISKNSDMLYLSDGMSKLYAIDLSDYKVYSYETDNGYCTFNKADNKFYQFISDDNGMTGEMNVFDFTDGKWNKTEKSVPELNGYINEGRAVSDKGNYFIIFADSKDFTTMSGPYYDIKIINTDGEVIYFDNHAENLSVGYGGIFFNEETKVLDVLGNNGDSYVRQFSDTDNSDKAEYTKYAIVKHPGNPNAEENNWVIEDKETCDKISAKLDEILAICDDYKFIEGDDYIERGGDCDGYTIFVDKNGDKSDYFAFNDYTNEYIQYNLVHNMQSYVIPQEYITEISQLVDGEYSPDDTATDVEKHVLADVTSGTFTPEITTFSNKITAKDGVFKTTNGALSGKSYFELKDKQITYYADLTNNSDEDMEVTYAFFDGYEYYPDTGKEMNWDAGGGTGDDIYTIKSGETKTFTKTLTPPDDADYYVTYAFGFSIQAPEDIAINTDQYVYFEYR